MTSARSDCVCSVLRFVSEVKRRKTVWCQLREAWTRYDGKPREAWTDGPNLKETVLIAALIATLIVWTVVTILMLLDLVGD